MCYLSDIVGNNYKNNLFIGQSDAEKKLGKFFKLNNNYNTLFECT